MATKEMAKSYMKELTKMENHKVWKVIKKKKYQREDGA
jgi:hypothetical protein